MVVAEASEGRSKFPVMDGMQLFDSVPKGNTETMISAWKLNDQVNAPPSPGTHQLLG